MTIQIQPVTIGTVGFPISQWDIYTDNTESEVTTIGFLNDYTNSYSFKDGDFANVYTTDNSTLYMQISVSGDDTSLVNPYASDDSPVTYSGDLVDGNFAVYDGSTGVIQDLGYSPSNAAKTKVVMVNGNTTVGKIAVYTDTSGTIGVDAATAINVGNIVAGTDATLYGGYFISYPGTAGTGLFAFKGIANSGNYNISFQNASMGQSTTITVPDPGAATANVLLNTGANTMAAGSRITLAKVNGTEASNAVTASGMSGVITTSSLTTAAGASYAIAWTNTFMTATSTVVLTVQGGTNTRHSFKLEAVPVSNGCTLTIYNTEPTNALNGTILIGYVVF
jgi:hypothetical protein